MLRPDPPDGPSGRDSWLRTGDATALLGVTPATVRRWADAGHFVTWVTPGGHRRFERSSLLAFAAQDLATDGRSPAPSFARVGIRRNGDGCHDGCERRGYHGLWLEAQRLVPTLVAVVQGDGADPALAETADAAAARFGLVAASRKMTANQLVDVFFAIRDPLLRAVSASACLRGLDGAAASDLLVEAISRTDRLLQRSLAAHQAFRVA
jgi:excisionase family DNA binding protein